VPALLATAFLSGLLGSLHCVAMCGAFATSCARQRAGLPLWHAGRLASYAALGAAAAAAGYVLPGPAWIPALLASVFLLWFALALAGLVRDLPLLPAPFERAARRALTTPTPAAQLLFGAINGFLPCGLVYAALSLPIAVADPLKGAALMLAFGSGTVPALTAAATGLQRVVLGNLRRRRLLAAVLLIAGLWAIWSRAAALHPGHQHPPTVPSDGTTVSEGR
jgi:sulfite exporter TauE/SafE